MKDQFNKIIQNQRAMFAIDNYDFKGKRAIIRVDFNVPLNEKGEVTDDTRIRAAIPTIKKVLEKGGSVILMSHLGRPKKNPDPKFSLEQIVPAIEKRLGVKVMFAGDCMGEKAAEMAANLKPGEVMLLENLRFYAVCTFSSRIRDFGADSPALGAGKLVLVRQKTFVGQGHNLLCSLEQRILINSDCHATFTQKEVFSDQILFQYPLLKRSITAWLSVSIRTSGDI